MKLIALALLLAFASTSYAADSKGAAQVEDAWRTAMLANDVDAVVKCYASDATLWIGGTPRLDGTDAIRATYAAWLGANTIKDVAFTNRKSQQVGYRQLSLDYVRGSPLIPEGLRNVPNLGGTSAIALTPIQIRAFIGFGNYNSDQDADYTKVLGGIRGNLPFKETKQTALAPRPLRRSKAMSRLIVWGD